MGDHYDLWKGHLFLMKLKLFYDFRRVHNLAKSTC